MKLNELKKRRYEGENAAGDKAHSYEDAAGKWRWTLRSVNHRVVGASTQGYAKRAGKDSACENLERVTGITRA